MCGIVGVTSSRPVLEVILDGLSRLEYRGYDSAGIALQDGGKVWNRRKAGKLNELTSSVSDAPQGASTGIGHTRWATHGRPNDENAHPHTDCTGKLAVVHNGIIENYVDLGDEIVAKGHELTSQTDTEVLVHLIEEELKTGASLYEAVRQCLQRVEGSFSIAVIHADEPDLIVAARRGSPLIVGRSESAGFVASDIPAILGNTEEVFVLDDDQMVELRPDSFRMTTLAGDEVKPKARKIDWDLAAAEKGGYEDFMLKEIHEQPRAIHETLLGRLLADGTLMLDEMRLSDDELRSIDKVFIIGCGTSYYAGLVAKYAIEHWTRLPVEADISSEFRYRDPVLNSNTLVVGVSQSGETIDTLFAMREAKRWGAKVLAISNVVDSSMARDADAVLYTRAGPEVGVAATKTHLAQIVVMQILALYLAQLRGTVYPDDIAKLLGALEELPEKVEDILQRSEEVAKVAEVLKEAEQYFFLGRGVGYPVALEGALKMKEISYLRAEGYPAGELKHGPIALIEPGRVVVGIATQGRLQQKMLSNLEEVAARGATIVVVANEGDPKAELISDLVMTVPRTHELFSPALDVVPLQLLAYYLAKARGNDVDKPRNLAKTVTVE